MHIPVPADTEKRAIDFIELLKKYNVSKENAEREATRLQNEVNSINLLSGISLSKQPKPLYPLELFKNQLRGYKEDESKQPLEITIAIHGHACDIPFMLFNNANSQIDVDYKHFFLPRVKMISSVPHGCINTGPPESFFTMLQSVFRNKSKPSSEQLLDVKREMTPKLQYYQQHESEIGDGVIDSNTNKLAALDPSMLYRIHVPVTDREYTFNESKFGIYIVHSTDKNDDIEYSYADPIIALSQKNNILSTEVSPSLKKYTDLIKHYLNKVEINEISLQELLYCLFMINKWDTVRIIDLGCRLTCKPSKFKIPEMYRIKSTDFNPLETEPTQYGKKYRIKQKLIKSKKLSKHKHTRKSLKYKKRKTKSKF